MHFIDAYRAISINWYKEHIQIRHKSPFMRIKLGM